MLTDFQKKEIKRLAATNKYFFTEIAEKLNIKANNVRQFARIEGIKAKKPNGQHNIKYPPDFVRRVMTYFLTHSWDQTKKKFSLNQSQLKSLMTNGYKKHQFKHLRKDTRRKDPWSLKEVLSLLRGCGLLPRDELSSKIRKSNYKFHAVKDMFSLWGAGETRYLNGMNKTWLRDFGIDVPDRLFIKTRSGPGHFKFSIVPWVLLEDYLKSNKIKFHLSSAIHAMAKYQRFIHQTDSNDKIVRRMKGLLK